MSTQLEMTSYMEILQMWRMWTCTCTFSRSS